MHPKTSEKSMTSDKGKENNPPMEHGAASPSGSDKSIDMKTPRKPVAKVIRKASAPLLYYDDGTRHVVLPAHTHEPERIASTGSVIVTSSSEIKNHENNIELDDNEKKQKTDKLREEIRELQSEASKNFRSNLKQEAKKFLPAHVFQKDPQVKEDKRDENTPTLLELEITRAKASAELNVYLNHCQSPKKKLRFLTLYKELEDEAFKGEIKAKMQELAKLNSEIGEDGNLVYFSAEKQAKKGKSGPKSAVHLLGPMAPKTLGFPSSVAATIPTDEVGEEQIDVCLPQHQGDHDDLNQVGEKPRATTVAIGFVFKTFDSHKPLRSRSSRGQHCQREAYSSNK